MILNVIAEWFQGWIEYFGEDRRRIIVAPLLALFWAVVAHFTFIGLQGWRFLIKTGDGPLEEAEALQKMYVLGTEIPYYGTVVDFILPVAVMAGFIIFVLLAMAGTLAGTITFTESMKYAHKEIL